MANVAASDVTLTTCVIQIKVYILQEVDAGSENSSTAETLLKV